MSIKLGDVKGFMVEKKPLKIMQTKFGKDRGKGIADAMAEQWG